MIGKLDGQMNGWRERENKVNRELWLLYEIRARNNLLGLYVQPQTKTTFIQHNHTPCELAVKTAVTTL